MKDPVERAVDRAHAWLAVNPAPPGDLAMLADEAWFYELLVRRHADDPRRDTWRGQSAACLRGALALGVAAPDEDEQRRDPWGACGRLVASVMLAHLLHVRGLPDDRTAAFIERTVAAARASPRLLHLTSLHELVFRYNLGKLGVHVPPRAPPLAALALPAAVVRLLEGYRHTHEVFFDSDAFAVPRLPAARYPHVTALIEASREAFEREGAHDLLGEFAYCLALLGQRASPTFTALVTFLLAAQGTDGTWTHPSYSEREVRHATWVGLLALEEARAPCAV